MTTEPTPTNEPTAEKSIGACLSDSGFTCKHIPISDHSKLEAGIKMYADQQTAKLKADGAKLLTECEVLVRSNIRYMSDNGNLREKYDRLFERHQEAVEELADSIEQTVNMKGTADALLKVIDEACVKTAKLRADLAAKDADLVRLSVRNTFLSEANIKLSRSVPTDFWERLTYHIDHGGFATDEEYLLTVCKNNIEV